MYICIYGIIYCDIYNKLISQLEPSCVIPNLQRLRFRSVRFVALVLSLVSLPASAVSKERERE